MKNTIVFIVVILLNSLDIFGALLNPSTRLRISDQPVMSRDQDELSPYQPLILQISDDQVINVLTDMGVLIFKSRDDMLLASIPREVLTDVLELPGILNCEASGDMSSNMNLARPVGFVNELQAGADPLGQKLDGTGIVIGFSDIGFDAHHIAFKDRIAAIYDYDAYQGISRKAESVDEIAEWTTDNPDEWHATHVANIFGGGYKGNPYYGVATGAEFVATTSRLSDVGILSGVEDIISYAKKVGKPAVINLSLGNYLGPHDGTDLFCRYLSSCTKDAIICMSAGNSGNSYCYASQHLIDENKIYQLAVNTLIDYNGFKVFGETELWSSDSTPFDVRIEVYDITNKEIIYTSSWITEEGSLTVDDTDIDWHKYMTGRIKVVAGLSPSNNRYCVSIGYDTQTEEVSPNSDGKWSRYYTAIAFKKGQSQRDVFVEVFADAVTSNIGTCSKDTRPSISNDGSISDLCTAKGVIAVGACSTRNAAPTINHGELTWDFETGNVAIFSSYSNSPVIERLPHVSAPGNYTISAMSSEYLKNHESEIDQMSCVSNVGGTDYYWRAECGTSMASPYTAGIIAQWLQVDPTLNSEDVLEIIKKTANRDFPDIDDPRWGAGCIDAISGLKQVIAGLDNFTHVSLPHCWFDLYGHLISDVPIIAVYDVYGRRYNKYDVFTNGVYIILFDECTVKLVR